MAMAEDDSPSLPTDIVLEILSRTSLKTLGSCRVVSKEIKKITYGSAFTKLFFKRTETVSGFFIQNKKYRHKYVSMSNIPNPNPKLHFTSIQNQASAKILAASKSGFLLCKYHNHCHYYVCHPITNLWQKVPRPRTNRSLHTKHRSFGMVVLGTRPLRYKIVKISIVQMSPMILVRLEIFDSEIRKWKLLDDVISFSKNGLLSIMSQSLVSVCGIIFMFFPSTKIFAFNLVDESWEIIGLPDPLCRSDYCLSKKLVAYEDRVGMICMGLREEHCMELWVKEDISGTENSWSKRYKVCIRELRTREPKCKAFPIGLFNDEVVVLVDYENLELIFYKFDDCSFNVVDLDKRFCERNYPFCLYHFQSDLEPQKWCLDRLLTCIGSFLSKRLSCPRFSMYNLIKKLIRI